MENPGILAPQSQGTLLLVDDEENILSSLRRLLRRDGYHIFTAQGGEAALNVLTQNPVDIIVSDQRMPGMTGTEFLRRARDIRPDTIRIVLSGYTELESVTSAINDGAVYKFLTKPWNDEQLRLNIAEAFRRKSLDDENRRLQNELAHANIRLMTLIEERQRLITLGEMSLNFTHEVIALLPYPILGMDLDELIVLANKAAESLFNTQLLGSPARSILPATLCANFNLNASCFYVSPDGHTYNVECRQLGSPEKSRGFILSFIPTECQVAP